MKTLYLTRHAKSDWHNIYLADIDRTLNERGLRDAPLMGKRLFHQGVQIDGLVSSTAKRAAQTAQLLAKEIQFPLANIQWEKILYHAPPETIRSIIFSLDNAWQSAMIVCHNPGITDFANSLLGQITDNIPTCGIVAFCIHTDQWEKYPQAPIDFLWFDYPKKAAP